MYPCPHGRRDSVTCVPVDRDTLDSYGLLEAGESPQDEQSQTARRVQLPSISSLLSDIAKEVDGGIPKAEAIRTDQHSLIGKAVEVSNQRRTDQSAPSLLETIDEICFDKNKSCDTNLARAKGFAIKCHTGRGPKGRPTLEKGTSRESIRERY